MAVPIFDTCAHPTLDGSWKNPGQNADFEGLATELKTHHFIGACAIGLVPIGRYSHEKFIAACQKQPLFFPVIPIHPLDPQALDDMSHHREDIVGIKLHPRFSKFRLDQHFDNVKAVCQTASELNLPVFYCSYYFDSALNMPYEDPFFGIVRLLAEVPNLKLILMHGGGVEFLRYAELARHNPNLLLDLSLTLTKYAGSSLDADIRFAFQKFDQKICIGSDSPEWPLSTIRTRFETFSDGISANKQKNIAYRNVLQFLNLDLGIPA